MAKTVFGKKEAEDVASVYVPRKFPLFVTENATQFLQQQKNVGMQKSFHMDPIIAEQTGIAKMQRQSLEQQIETEVLERLKLVQENAYHEAHQLGLQEGEKKAFNQVQSKVQSQIERLEQILSSIETSKLNLLAGNEKHIVTLLYHIACRLVGAEIEKRPDLILTLVRSALEEAQSEEQVVIRLSPDDLKYVEENRENLLRESNSTSEDTKRIKLEASESVSPGGCILETNYGSIDATLEQRSKRLWAALAEHIPKSSDRVESA